MSGTCIDTLCRALVKYVDSVKAAITDRELSKLVDFIKYGGDLYVTYSGPYASPATYLVLLLKSLTRVNAYLVDPEVITYYIAPYSEEGSVRRVLIVSSGGDGILARLLDHLNLTGYDVMVLSFGKLVEALKHKVSEGSIIEFELNDLLLQHLVLGLAIGNYLDRTNVRVRRLWYELSNLSEVIEDLIKTYLSKLQEITDFTKDEFLVVSTPSMLGVAEDITYNYSRPSNRYLIPFNAVKHYVKYVKKLLIVSTDVEEYSIRELKWLSTTGNISICELRLKTDPLTAPIYGLILSKTLSILGDLRC